MCVKLSCSVLCCEFMTIRFCCECSSLFCSGMGETDRCCHSLDQQQSLVCGVPALGSLCSEEGGLHQPEEALCAQVTPPLPSLCQ